MSSSNNIPFSIELEHWLKSPGPKTLASLDKVFAEKSFAVIFTILLAVAALPVPTGGLTHLFGFLSALTALQVVAGRRNLWIPKRWRELRLGPTAQQKFIPTLIRFIRWLERYSRPRMIGLLGSAPVVRFYGIAVMTFSAAVTVTPPFSGLDTLPAMGVVLMSLAIILEDSILFLVGLVVGTVGVSLMIFLGAAAFEFFSRLI
jgi:hypothetical protein